MRNTEGSHNFFSLNEIVLMSAKAKAPCRQLTTKYFPIWQDSNTDPWSGDPSLLVSWDPNCAASYLIVPV